MLENLKSYTLWGNTGYDYLVAVIIFIGLIIVLKIIQSIIVGRLKKLAKRTRTDLDDVLISVFTSIKPPFYLLLAFYFGFRSLSVPEMAEKVIYVLFLIVIVYEITRALERLLIYAFEKYLNRKAKEDGGSSSELGTSGKEQIKSMMNTAKVILRILLWVLGLLLILSNLGINITSLVASLGIGGIAVALALQNILSDMFSSFSIYIDKPFVVGDYIVIGTDRGTVEKIGLKTTRLRTLQGEELIVSNKELTTARVQNFKRMKRRRVNFEIGVVYSTTQAKLEKIPKVVEKIIEGVPEVDFDRCHFKSYGDFSLNFEIVYYVNSSDYTQYMDLNQKINMEIYKNFAKEKLEFAYPTQVVYVNKG